jgi:hypothetical protein
MIAPSKLNTIETFIYKIDIPREANRNTPVSIQNTFYFLIGYATKSKSYFLVKKCKIGITDKF